jgi:hypothetical protein
VLKLSGSFHWLHRLCVEWSLTKGNVSMHWENERENGRKNARRIGQKVLLVEVWIRKLGEYRCNIKSRYPREDGDRNGNPKEQAGVASGIQFVSGVGVKSRSLDKACANS